MWIWTLDEQLLNLNQVETIEVVTIYETWGEVPELEDLDDEPKNEKGQNLNELGSDDFEDDPEPSSYKVMAFLSSGNSVNLYEHEDETLVTEALELLAAFIGAHDMIDSFSQGQVLSLAELMKKRDEATKN